MSRSSTREPSCGDDCGFDGARRFALELAQRMTPAERLRWLEETVTEMRTLVGLAKPSAQSKTSP